MVFANPFAAILAPPMGGRTAFRARVSFSVAAVGATPFAATHIISVSTASRLAADRACRVVGLHWLVADDAAAERMVIHVSVHQFPGGDTRCFNAGRNRPLLSV